MKLELKDINFSYGKKKVLTNINLEFYSGNVYYIHGDNGKGKTTLVNMIAGISAPNSGNIKIDNEVKTPEALRIIYSTLLVQNNTCFEIFSLLELLQFYNIVYEEENYLKIITNLGIAHLEDKKLSDVSGGEKQRLMLSLVLLLDKPILILDEFENNLDAETIEFVNNELSNTNKLVIIISHAKNTTNINYYDLNTNEQYFNNIKDEAKLNLSTTLTNHKLYKGYINKFKKQLII